MITVWLGIIIFSKEFGLEGVFLCRSVSISFGSSLFSRIISGCFLHIVNYIIQLAYKKNVNFIICTFQQICLNIRNLWK